MSYILLGQFVLIKTVIFCGGQKEQNTSMNLLMFLSGVLVRNGGSFEDDLSLGAEGMFGRTVPSYSFKIKKNRERESHVFSCL